MANNLNLVAQRSHNLRNALHTIILVVGTGLLMGVMAYSVLGIGGLIVALALAAVGLVGLGRVSPQMVLKLYRARPLTAHELPELHDVVEKLATRAELPSVPQLFYVPSKMLNAFAVGRRDNAAIAVTDALLRTMTMRQIAGILAHEISHVANGDLRVMGMADILNRITSFMATLGLLGIPAVFGMGLNLPVYTLALMIFAPTIGGLLQLGLSRAREYDADLDGVTLTGDPEGLASALALLEEKQKHNWEGLILPGSRMPQPSLLRTHPKTEDRIARLLAVRLQPREQITIRPEARPNPSVVPPFRNPRIQWARMGVYY